MGRKAHIRTEQRSESHRKRYLHPERRGDVRHPSAQKGTYLKNLAIGDTTRFDQGQVTMVNESGNGALLQMSRSLNSGDIIEVQWPQSAEEPTTTIYEVRWSQPLEPRVDCHGYEIGCGLLFSTEWINTFTPSEPTARPTLPGVTLLPAVARPRLLRR